MPFANPVMAAKQLVREVMQSDNFDILTQAGWAIYRNGDAYFFQLQLDGGSLIITGTGGLFIYAGTAELGNRPIFWIGGDTADPFGNQVSAGQGSTGLPALFYGSS